jgi:hypothetical protein
MARKVVCRFLNYMDEAADQAESNEALNDSAAATDSAMAADQASNAVSENVANSAKGLA